MWVTCVRMKFESIHLNKRTKAAATAAKKKNNWRSGHQRNTLYKNVRECELQSRIVNSWGNFRWFVTLITFADKYWNERHKKSTSSNIAFVFLTTCKQSRSSTVDFLVSACGYIKRGRVWKKKHNRIECRWWNNSS